MRKLILLAATAAFCLSAPALAKPGHGGGNSGNTGQGGNGGNGGGNSGGGSGSGPIACGVHDISITALACSGFYAGNLLDNSDIVAQVTGLQAVGFNWDGNFNALVAAGDKFDANGATTLNFAQPLSGMTVMGIHFGGGGPGGVGNGTAFYRFDAGTALHAIDLLYHGSSGVVIYSTGHVPPPPPPPVEQGAVPEPASWAMMIAGFGLVGAAMRRQRTAVRFA